MEVVNMDFEKIKSAAEGYKAEMSRFLRDMISFPSESCEEKEVVMCIKAEMEKLGFDKVEIDGLGNVIGWMGQGEKIIAIDSHIDTVGVGNVDNWEADPYKGYETEEIIYGRGGSDQEGGMASAVYGTKIMKDLGLIPEGYQIMVVGSVQEEDCDGMCWQYIVNKYFNGPEDARSKIEFVISTEPTDGGIYRGHRGRMEIRVDVKGVSCHGSAPHRGDNAIYKMADILQDVRALNENGDGPSNTVKGLVKMLNPEFNPAHYEDAQFLGRGTCTTSQIFYTSPSRCAVADSCSISIDRRMTAGETWDSCLQEIRDLPSVKKYGDDVKVSMYMYDRPAWTGTVYETECFFPTWINKASAAHVQALVDAHHALWGDERIGYADADQSKDAMHLRTGRPLTDKWTFSTNCVSIQGRYGIPCVGFGPGAESQAHAPNEITWKQDLVTCAALYAAVPGLYRPENKTADVTEFRQSLTNNDIK
jgi:putative selenium metabolism hydrolase